MFQTARCTSMRRSSTTGRGAGSDADGMIGIRDVSPIAWILALVGAFRLSLLGRGAMAFLDETMYYKAGLALDALRAGHLTGALTHIASNNGRPGNALVQLVPAALQAVP